MTAEVLADLGLSERQRKALDLISVEGRLTNQQYQARFGVSKATASRDLENLETKGVLLRVGTTGKGTYYVLRAKGRTRDS